MLLFNVKMAIFIFKTHYPSGQTWANICSSPWLRVSSIKTGTRRTMHLDELYLVVRRSKRISKDSSSRRIIRLLIVFLLETHNQDELQMLAQVCPDG